MANVIVVVGVVVFVAAWLYFWAWLAAKVAVACAERARRG